VTNTPSERDANVLRRARHRGLTGLLGLSTLGVLFASGCETISESKHMYDGPERPTGELATIVLPLKRVAAPIGESNMNGTFVDEVDGRRVRQGREDRREGLSPTRIYVTPGKHDLRVHWTIRHTWCSGHGEFIAEAGRTYYLAGEPSEQGGILFTMKTHKGGEEVAVPFRNLPK